MTISMMPKACGCLLLQGPGCASCLLNGMLRLLQHEATWIGIGGMEWEQWYDDVDDEYLKPSPQPVVGGGEGRWLSGCRWGVTFDVRY